MMPDHASCGAVWQPVWMQGGAVWHKRRTAGLHFVLVLAATQLHTQAGRNSQWVHRAARLVEYNAGCSKVL